MRVRNIALAALAALAVPTAAGAFEVKHAPGGQLVRWTRGSVAWTIDRSVQDVDGGEAAVAHAVGAWSQKGGAPSLAVAASDAKLEPGLDGVNAVFFVEGGFEPAGKALAVTILSYDERTGEILDADIVLNGKYHLAPVAPVTPSEEGEPSPPNVAPEEGEATDPATYDVGRVVAHEMGHALGLSDEPADPTALMYPYVARAVALSTSPADDDVAGLTKLYARAVRTSAASVGTTEDGEDVKASPEKGVSCTGAVVAPGGPTSGSQVGYVAIGLGVLALAFSRRSRAAGAASCSVLAAVVVIVPALGTTGAEPSAVTRASAVVTHVRTSSAHGVLRSELELTTTSCGESRCPAVSRAVVWGGTLDGVRQVVAGRHVPIVGEHVGVLLPRRLAETHSN